MSFARATDEDVQCRQTDAIECFVKWGVYRYGKTDVLLHYYAKHLNGPSAAAVERIRRAKKLDLDINVTCTELAAEVHVVWKGKPAVNRQVYVRGPERVRHKLTTDKNGRASFAVKKSGRYTFRTGVIERDKSGEFEGKQYTQFRHNGTLTVRLPLSH